MHVVWIIVPAFQEERRIAEVLGALTQVVSHGFPGVAAAVHVVVVDDGSTDATPDAVRNFPGVWLLRHPVNRGQGAAIQTGIDFALAQRAEIVVTFDADGQHAADDLPQLIGPILRNEADVALGSRFLGSAQGMPLSRRVLLKAAVVLTRLMTGLAVTDTHNGLRAFSCHAIRQFRITEDGMAHASEILDSIRLHHLKYVEVPVSIRYTPEVLAKGQRSLNGLRILGRILLGKVMR